MSSTMLDPTFGSGGGVLVAVPGATAMAVAVDHQNRVIAAGHTAGDGDRPPSVAVTRLTPDGRLDRTFGDAGVTLMPSWLGGRCATLSAQPGGQLLLTISLEGHQPRSLIVGIDEQGHIDPSIGPRTNQPDGSPHPPGFHPLALTNTVTGAFLAAGSLRSPTAPAADTFALARYRPDGEPDEGFGIHGLATTEFAGRHYDVSALLEDAHGGIVVVGCVRHQHSVSTVILRYHQNGRLDGGFGHQGMVHEDLPTGDTASAAQLIPATGHIVIVGSRRVGSRTLPNVTAYHADGAPDPTFAALTQSAILNTGLGGAFQTAVVASPTQLTLAGHLSRQQTQNPTAVGVVRLNHDGALIPSFGVGGVVITPLAGRDISATSAAIDTEQRLVVTARTGQQDGLVVLRYIRARTSADPASPAPYKNAATIADEQQSLMQQIQHAHRQATEINRGIY